MNFRRLLPKALERFLFPRGLCEKAFTHKCPGLNGQCPRAFKGDCPGHLGTIIAVVAGVVVWLSFLTILMIYHVL